MGNGESSTQLKNLVINKKAVESGDFWSLFNAEIQEEASIRRLVSIFQSEPLTNPQLWANDAPLERFTKNLKIYRHPNILRYIAAWNKGSVHFLATERVRPLSLNLNSQTDVQICLGLRSVLTALIFLVETANLRHLNVCSSSIYICTDGSWKLGGLEYVWKASEISKSLLEKSQHHRYTNAIDPSEIKSNSQSLEQFSFANLCDEILRNRPETATEFHVNEFKSYCETHLKHKQVSMRPTLAAILLHPYFNHDFITIHSFLTELPLKSQPTKMEFFEGLTERLRKFDEVVVATQLADMLLSRIVLLDETALMCVTPFVLKSQSGEWDTELNVNHLVKSFALQLSDDSLFSPETFVKHIIPKLKQIFCVRDVQIRLVLLEFFNQYAHFFTRDEIVGDILPQLLLGIKDTNDLLVTKTLLCLADLIPLIGGNAVIGANRTRIFADGRPQFIPNNDENAPRSISPVLNSTDFLSGSPPLSVRSDSLSNNVNFLSELRPEPDGGEAVDEFRMAQSTVLASETEQEFGDWSDWDNELNEPQAVPASSGEDDQAFLQANLPVLAAPKSAERPSVHKKEQIIDNIAAFDITIQAPVEASDDFFRDMEPVIQKTSILVVNSGDEGGTQLPADEVVLDKKRFEMAATDAAEESGWNDADEDWGN
jgi:SCY1-like protein 3